MDYKKEPQDINIILEALQPRFSVCKVFEKAMKVLKEAGYEVKK